MIKGRHKTVILTKELILSKISTYDIYRFYQGPFVINEVCVNRHRGEKDPSLIIGTKMTGELTHKDFGDYTWRGDAFHFVQQLFRCDYPTALGIIDRDFNLGLSGNKVEAKPVITWKQPIIDIKKPPVFHVVYYSKMNKASLDYWARLGQGEEDLKRERIYQPKEIYRNHKRVPIREGLLFGFHYEDIDKWKIYRPFAPKNPEGSPPSTWKWDSNVPFDYVDNLGVVEGCQKIWVAKSKKDRMVLMKALDTKCVVDVQAEDPACLSVEDLDKIKQVPQRFIVSDNDKKGKEFSWWLTKQHGFKHVNVPDSYLTSDPKCTDFADLCYHYGMDTVINHFKSKGVI